MGVPTSYVPRPIPGANGTCPPGYILSQDRQQCLPLLPGSNACDPAVNSAIVLGVLAAFFMIMFILFASLYGEGQKLLPMNASPGGVW
jgi:hypothetical protein